MSIFVYGYFQIWVIISFRSIHEGSLVYQIKYLEIVIIPTQCPSRSQALVDSLPTARAGILLLHQPPSCSLFKSLPTPDMSNLYINNCFHGSSVSCICSLFQGAAEFSSKQPFVILRSLYMSHWLPPPWPLGSMRCLESFSLMPHLYPPIALSRSLGGRRWRRQG